MTSPNALLAPTVEGPVSSWAGLALAEDVDQVLSGVRGGSWVDASIGGVSAGLDALAFVADPVGALLQYGIAWLIEHVKPLSEALDWLAGDPAVIAAQSRTWHNVAEALRLETDELIRSVQWDTSEWFGEAGDAYRDWSTNQRNAVTALSTSAEAMATAVGVAGELIAGVRIMVRDAIATVVARLISYAIEELATLGLATPLLVTQVTTLCAQWSSRIARWLHGLVSSIHRLRTLTDQLAEALEALQRLLRRLGGAESKAPEPVLHRVRKRGAGATQYFRLEVAYAVAEKYGIDLSGLDISLGDKAHRGECGSTYRDGSIELYSPGFRSEEDLARTLVHEKFHRDELALGIPFPQDEAERNQWEDRAYDYEDEWWDNQPIRPEPRTR
ncbi:WXG100 family type VII secretion target [Actinoplanes sp. NPDC051513]|uniref:WXG100 family type VII secretion target n=1 Tax=Actinoplanes sp. NPDC051513 TaxID=3363908 RepID=UPI0037B5D485